MNEGILPQTWIRCCFIKTGPIAPFDATDPELTRSALLAIPLSAPSLSFQRKPCCPRRQLANQVAQLFEGTESLWNFGYKLVVYMQDDRITACLDVEDCAREQVAGYCLCQVLGTPFSFRYAISFWFMVGDSIFVDY